ncbi:MAG: hypothetical protein H7831_18040, partial [Magnetococcus sp. WYHC-3]
QLNQFVIGVAQILQASVKQPVLRVNPAFGWFHGLQETGWGNNGILQSYDTIKFNPSHWFITIFAILSDRLSPQFLDLPLNAFELMGVGVAASHHDRPWLQPGEPISRLREPWGSFGAYGYFDVARSTH